MSQLDPCVTIYADVDKIVIRPVGQQGVPGEGVPDGGTTGQVLAKASNDDYDTLWTNVGGGSSAVLSVNGYTGIVILNADDVGAYSNTNPQSFINSAGAPVQSVNGKTGTITLNANDVGAYSNTNPSNFISASGAPIQSVTGTLVTGTASDPIVNIPTLDEVGAYSNTNPSGFVNASGASVAAPVQSVNGDTGNVSLSLDDLFDVNVGSATNGQVLTYNSTVSEWQATNVTSGGGGSVESVTGDGVDNSDPANPVLSFPTLNDIGAYSNTNPSNFVNASGASSAAPIQSVTGTLVGGTSSDPVINIPTVDQVGAYSNTNPDNYITIAEVPVQSVTGDGVDNTNVGNVVISYPTVDDIGAYSNTNPSGFITSSEAPIQSVTGTLVTGTSADPVINIPTLDQVGAYSNTNPSGFINITQVPIKTVTGDGVDNTNVGNVVISWPTPDDIGAYSNTNPAGYITSAQAPVQSVNGKTNVVVLDVNDVGAYSNTNPSNFINVAQASAAAPVQSVTGTLVTGTSTNPVVNIPTLDQVGAYSNTNPSNFINASGAPVQSVYGRTGAVTANFGDYNASLVQSNTFTGVTATNVQDALEQLGTTKLTAIQTISDKTTNYTFVLSDAFSFQTMSNASNSAFTIPQESNVAFSNGTSIDLMRKGAGNVFILGETNVVLRAPLGATFRTQNSVATAIKIGTNDWLVTGDLTS